MLTPEKIGLQLFEGDDLVEAADALDKNSIEYIEFRTGSWTDLDLLRQYDDSIRWISISTPDVDWDVVFSMKGLRWLTLKCMPPEPVYLSELRRLRVLEFRVGGRLAPGHSALNSVLDLRYDYFPGDDLGVLPVFPNLTNLSVANSNSLKSLNGLDACTRLTGIYLYGCRNLREIGSVPDSVEQIQVGRCPRLNNYGPLGAVSSLRQLELNGPGTVESMSFAVGLTRLQYLVVDGRMRVPDESIEFLRDLPALEHAAYPPPLRPSASEMPNGFSGSRRYRIMRSPRHLPSKVGIVSGGYFDGI